MTTVAVMQPYFIPYAGYFRLFAACDVVALFDCVQFPRRGWVHRNRLYDANGQLSWFTLPLKKMPVETKIQNLEFTTDAADKINAQIARFPALKAADMSSPVMEAIQTPGSSVVDYLEDVLKECCAVLNIPFHVVRTSSLSLDDSMRGQERIIEAVKRLNGSRYVNLSGGRQLYGGDVFNEAGVSLKILPEFKGDFSSILQRLSVDPPETVRHEIVSQL